MNLEFKIAKCIAAPGQAATVLISASDEFGRRGWLAHPGEHRPKVHPIGEPGRDCFHSFPSQVRERIGVMLDAAPFEHVTVYPLEVTRIQNDTNGNPRYVVHYLRVQTDADRAASMERRELGAMLTDYPRAVKRANTRGGRKYHCRAYGGGIVFQSYGGPDEVAAICSDLSGRVYYPV